MGGLFALRRSFACLCLFAGLISLGLTVRAQPVPARGVALNWVRLTGAESCIAPVDLAQRIEQRLARPVFSRASDAILVIEGRVGPAAQTGYTTLIRFGDPHGALYGSREVSVADPDCHKLDEIVALIIGITLRQQSGSGIALPAVIMAQLDALFAGEPSELDPAELAKPAAAAVTRAAPAVPPRPPPAPPASANAERSVRALWFQVEAGLGVSTGVAPSPTLAPLLRLRLERPGLGSAALEARLGLLQEERAASEPQGTLGYRSLALALAGCLELLGGAALQLSLCVDARTGRLDVSARDFVDGDGSRKFWVELEAAARFIARLAGPAYAHATLGVPWRLIRPRFQYEDSQGEVRDALTVARFGLDLSLGLGLDF